MSTFQYEIHTPDLSEMSKIAEEDLINSYMRLDKPMRVVIGSLCAKGVVKIESPDISQRRKILAWLSQNPLMMKNADAAIATPIFYSYHETANHITVNAEISGFMEQMDKVIKKHELPPIHLKRKRTASLIAELVMEKKQRKSFTVEELRKILSVADADFATYNDMIGVLEPIQREITSAGGSFKYYPDDDENVSKITIDVIYPKEK